MSNVKVNNLKEEVVVLKRSKKELHEALKKAEKDLSLPKKCEKTLKATCTKVQSFSYSFRTKNRAADTTLSCAQANVLASHDRSVSSFNGVSKKLVSSLDSFK